MITVPAGVRIYLACGVTDMRKGFDGLGMLVQDVLKQDPFSGAIFCFRGRRGDLIKLLYWDGQGFCLFAKRLEADLYPALVVCHGPNGRKWFARAPMVPRKWFPQSALDAESAAFGVQFGSQEGTSHPSKIGADAWFDCFDADRYEVLEQTLRTAPYETVSLISITDGRMLEDGDGRPSRRW